MKEDLRIDVKTCKQGWDGTNTGGERKTQN